MTVAAAVFSAAQALTERLAFSRYRQGREDKLHEDLAGVLTRKAYDFAREVSLTPRDRIDFLVEGGIGIECKARASKRPIFRQLQRYAESPAIDALILVTGTAMGLPAALNGKPVFYVSLGRASL